MSKNSKKSLKNPIQFFTSVSQNSIPPKVWFAILTLPGQSFSHSVEIFLSTLDYCQLLIQAILVGQNVDAGSKTTPEVVKTLFNLCKTLNPGSFMQVNSNDGTFVLGVFLSLTCYATLKFGFLVYIIKLCLQRSYGSKYLLIIWRWIFRFQGIVVYFLISSIWSNLFRVGYLNTLGLEPGYDFFLMFFSAGMIFVEFMFSVILIIHCTYSIPDKSILAAKNRYIEAISVFQKFMIQVIRNFFLNQMPTGMFIIIIFSCVVGVIRNLYYFTYYPHYKLKAALHHSTYLVIISCIYFAYLMQHILKHTYNNELNSSFGLVLWIILSIPLVSLNRRYVKNVWSNLFIRSESPHRDMIIHRVTAMKDILKESAAPTKSKNRNSHSYLLSMTAIVQINTFLGIKPENSPENLDDFDPKVVMKKFMMKYIQELLLKYPKNNLIRLYIASYYAQKLTMYGPAIRILHDLKHSSQFATALTAHMTIYFLQESLKNDYALKRNQLDLVAYIGNITLLTDLKEDMFTQAGFQADLYENMLKSSQDLGQIFKLAQKINNRRCIIEKKIRHMLELIPAYFLEPLAVCAHYSFLLNHAPYQYINYTKMYRQRSVKYEKKLLSNELCQENIHHKDTQVLAFSGNKKDKGIIKFVSKSYATNFGKRVIGHHVATSAEDNSREGMYHWVNFITEHAVKSNYDVKLNSFQYNFRGEHVVPCNYYFNLSPFLYEGLLCISVARFSKSNGEYIIVEGNGDIVRFTGLIGRKLGLFETKKHLPEGAKMTIDMISRNLARANHAINMVNFPGKFSEPDVWNLTEKEAQDLYSLFMTGGEELELSSLTNSKDRHIYHCKFENRMYGGSRMRAIALQKGQNYRACTEETRESVTSEEICLENEGEKEPEEAVPSENNSKLIPHTGNNNLLQSNLFTVKRGSSAINPDTNPAEYNRLNQAKESNNLSYTDQDGLTSRRLLTTRNIGENLGLTERTARGENPEHKTKNTKHSAYPLIDYKNQQKEKESTSTDNHKVSNQLSKDFHNAVNSKYYPYFFKALLLVLYLSFAGIMLSHIVFKESFSKDIQVLQARKNVAILGTKRRDLFIAAHGQARNMINYATGKQNWTNAPAILQPSTLFNRLKLGVIQMAQSNTEIFVTMNSLDSESRDRLFEKNVRIYDGPANDATRSFVNVTTFLAVQKIVETGLRGIALGTDNLQDVIPDFEMIITNSLNDLLIENEWLSDFLSNSIDQQRDSILKGNSAIFVRCICILILVLMVFSAVLMLQFRDERQNMLAVTRLDHGGITVIKDRVLAFQTRLQDETGFEKLENIEGSASLNPKSARDLTQYAKAKPNVHQIQDSDFRGISRKYHCHFLVMLALLAIVVVIMSVKFGITESLTNDLNYILNQIYFTAKSKPRIRLCTTIIQDMMWDSTTLTRNLPLEGQLNVELQYLQDLTQDITEILKTTDGTYDPFIQGVLFENACQYMPDNDSLVAACEAMRLNSTKAGLVQFLIEHKTAMVDFEIQYQASNKTQEALTALSQDVFGPRILPMLVIIDLINILSGQLDNTFSQTLAEITTTGDVGSGISYACVIIICLIIHFGVINRIKEAENQFRNVLKVFPAKLVLSNFMLKSYLIRTWKGTLDSVKLLSRD